MAVRTAIRPAIPYYYEVRRRAHLLAAADTDIGFVDAAVLAVVERLREPNLATLDRRHFSLVRPRHVRALQLVPREL